MSPFPQTETINEKLGVNVVIDDDDDDQPIDNDLDEIREEGDDLDDEGGEEARAAGALAAQGDLEGMDFDASNQDSSHVSADAIDAYWLQRQISQYIPDHHRSLALSEDGSSPPPIFSVPHLVRLLFLPQCFRCWLNKMNVTVKIDWWNSSTTISLILSRCS